MSGDPLPELALVPGGEFLMGSVDAEEDERPVHRVHLDDFYLGVQPVTNAEYGRFVRATGHRAPAIYELPIVVTVGGAERERTFRQTGAPYVWTDFDPPRGQSDHPVTLVRYDDAVAYCAWLSTRDGRAVPSADRSRMGEGRARRRGVQTISMGRSARPQHGELPRRPGAAEHARHEPVPAIPAERLRVVRYGGQRVGVGARLVRRSVLRDVAGARNPPGPRTDHMRLVRGGSWLVADVRMLSCSHRHKVPPDTYSYAIGFRVASSGR